VFFGLRDIQTWHLLGTRPCLGYACDFRGRWIHADPPRWLQSLVWLGSAWFGLVWFGLVRTGPVWHGSRREASRRRVSEGILNVYQFGLLFLFIPSSHSLLVQSSVLLTLSDYLVAVACQPEILSGRVPRSITGKIDLLIQLVDNVSRYHLISEAILEFACIPARSSMIHDNVRFSGEGVC
jgi:hypothetical protein